MTEQLELNPELNRIPRDVGTIHLIGVCGAAMGSLAGMLVEKGYRVTGSDQNAYPPMSDFLASLGIPVFSPYAAANLDYRPDLVVVGNVVKRENPEAPRLKELGLPYVSLPQALYEFFLRGKKPLAVAGTHGKTTTSAVCARLLDAAGLDPGFMIGGILGDYNRNYNVGAGDWFVVEADEYDTAFFDKAPKFVHYAPLAGVLTSVEFDHADIYADLAAVVDAFDRFAGLVPPDGLLAAWGDDPLVREIAGRCRGRVVFYGEGRDNDWRLTGLTSAGRRTVFDLLGPDGARTPLFSPLPGRHNALNTAAAAVVLDFAGVPPADLPAGLDSFSGVRRRQEVRGVEGGITVLDDFAHHPTAVRETTAAVRAAYPANRLVAVFEPRTNTSRRAVFQQNYARSFRGADLVFIRRPPDPDKAPEGDRFSSELLVEDLRAAGFDAFCFEETGALLEGMLERLREGDVVLIMSNGGFDGLHARLLEELRRKQG